MKKKIMKKKSVKPFKFIFSGRCFMLILLFSGLMIYFFHNRSYFSTWITSGHLWLVKRVSLPQPTLAAKKEQNIHFEFYTTLPNVRMTLPEETPAAIPPKIIISRTQDLGDRMAAEMQKELAGVNHKHKSKVSI